MIWKTLKTASVLRDLESTTPDLISRCLVAGQRRESWNQISLISLDVMNTRAFGKRCRGKICLYFLLTTSHSRGGSDIISSVCPRLIPLLTLTNPLSPFCFHSFTDYLLHSFIIFNCYYTWLWTERKFWNYAAKIITWCTKEYYRPLTNRRNIKSY